jgi:hypothetical protein
MRRLLLVLLAATLPPAAAIFFLTGCLTTIILVGDPDARKVHSAVWDAFPKGSEQAAKYLPLLSPAGSHGTSGDGEQETLEYRNVRRPAGEMAVALDTVRRDLLEMVARRGGVVVGDVRSRVEAGKLTEFEFVYKVDGRTGTIRGTVTAGQEAGAWDLVCVLAEELPRRGNQPAQ